MDHFESLRLFRTIVEVRNFRRAGQMLRVSPSVVSRAMTSLEERLVRLLGEHELLDTAAEVRLAYMSRSMVPARVRAFIDHAVAYFEEK